MSLDTDFYNLLDGLTAAAVQQNTISEDKTTPRLWFQRRESNTDLFANGAPCMTDTRYDVEVSGLDIDATATIADSLKVSLNGYRGGNFLGVFVEDAQDDYIPKDSFAVDEGFHVFAFTVRVIS